MTREQLAGCTLKQQQTLFDLTKELGLDFEGALKRTIGPSPRDSVIVLDLAVVHVGIEQNGLIY